MTKINVHIKAPDPKDTRKLPGAQPSLAIINTGNLWSIAVLCAFAAFFLWMYPWGQVVVVIGILFGLGLLAVLAGYAIKLKLEKRHDV